MNDDDELIPTRRSLLNRLKDWQDQASWSEFFETYWKLIYRTSLKAGLNDAEAQDVVQETMCSVSKSMPSYEYNEERGSFKGWLLRLTSWRIKDQFRKRQRGIVALPECETGTRGIERLEDSKPLGLEEVWEQEWEAHLFDAAVNKVKRQVEPEHYQVFYLYVVKQWPVSRVVQALKIGRARVYFIKHRISKLVKVEIEKLRAKGE